MVKIGDTVRVAVPGRRARIGLVIAEAMNGTCWRVEIGRGGLVRDYHKSYCTRVRPSRERTVPRCGITKS